RLPLLVVLLVLLPLVLTVALRALLVVALLGLVLLGLVLLAVSGVPGQLDQALEQVRGELAGVDLNDDHLGLVLALAGVVLALVRGAARPGQDEDGGTQGQPVPECSVHGSVPCSAPWVRLPAGWRLLPADGAGTGPARCGARSARGRSGQ